MFMNTGELINSLLYEEESNTLDFKSEQYKFIKATDVEKAELLKDIVAFVNAWRRTTAYILIGVKENKGQKAEIEGISIDLDDAQLQQFIQSKINKPINFSYLTTELEGKKIALIKIPAQNRPVFLKKDFGKLKANTVYIRRGSSTVTALPDEIAKMGVSDPREVQKSPKLKSFIACGDYDESQLDQIERTVIFAQLPNKIEFPRFGLPENMEGMHSSMLSIILKDTNEDYYFDFAKYIKQMQSLSIIKIGVKNEGNLVARDVRVEIDFDELPEGSSIFHENQLPNQPKQKNVYTVPIVRELDIALHTNNLNVTTISNGYRAKFTFGKIQTKESKVCEECLCLKIMGKCKINGNVTIYSDDLETPERMNLFIDINPEIKKYSVNEIIEFSKEFT